MKKILILFAVALMALTFVGCDISYKVQRDDSMLITLECDEDDIDEFGENYDFDAGDIDTIDDVEDILDDLLDEIDEIDGSFIVKSLKQKNDDFTIVVKYILADDIDDAVESGFAIGNAEELMDEITNISYDEDFEDVYDKEMSDDIDDEKIYAFDRKGEELSDKEFEKYFDKAKLGRLKGVYIAGGDDYVVTIPGTIKMIISYNDETEIEGRSIEAEDDIIVLYSKSSVLPLVVLLGMLALVAVGLGLYFFVLKKPEDNEDSLDEEFEIDAAE